VNCLLEEGVKFCLEDCRQNPSFFCQVEDVFDPTNDANDMPMVVRRKRQARGFACCFAKRSARPFARSSSSQNEYLFIKELSLAVFCHHRSMHDDIWLRHVLCIIAFSHTAKSMHAQIKGLPH
jgi:hypothetical protein